MSGEVLPLIGVRGLDGRGDWTGELERGSAERFIAALLDTTDEGREIAGDEGWDIGGEGGFAERVITEGSRKKKAGLSRSWMGRGKERKRITGSCRNYRQWPRGLPPSHSTSS